MILGILLEEQASYIQFNLFIQSQILQNLTSFTYWFCSLDAWVIMVLCLHVFAVLGSPAVVEGRGHFMQT